MRNVRDACQQPNKRNLFSNSTQSVGVQVYVYALAAVAATPHQTHTHFASECAIVDSARSTFKRYDSICKKAHSQSTMSRYPFALHTCTESANSTHTAYTGVLTSANRDSTARSKLINYVCCQHSQLHCVYFPWAVCERKRRQMRHDSWEHSKRN